MCVSIFFFIAIDFLSKNYHPISFELHCCIFDIRFSFKDLVLSLLFRSKAGKGLSFGLVHIFIEIKIVIIFIVFLVRISKFREGSRTDTSLRPFGKWALSRCFRSGQMRCCHSCGTCWIVRFISFLHILFLLTGKIRFDLFTILLEKRYRWLLCNLNILLILWPSSHWFILTLFFFRSFNLIWKSSHYFWFSKRRDLLCLSMVTTSSLYFNGLSLSIVVLKPEKILRTR